MSSVEPAFRSMALVWLPEPDYVDVIVRPLPRGATTDPTAWLRATFDVRRSPAWLKALFGLRQAAVPLLGIERSPRDRFAIQEVSAEEALTHASERHLDFAAALGVDAEQHLVRLTTTVRLHGWRGRVYFLPVRLAHRTIAGSMLRRAARELSTADAAPERQGTPSP
ncbi:MAG: DUF2867 domain-containing protein [Mycobacteriales bacterium]